MSKLKEVVKNYFHNFHYFYKYLKYRAFLVVILSISLAFLDGVGLTMFLPLLQSLNSKDTINENIGGLNVITNVFNSIGIPFNLYSVLGVILSVFLLKGLISYISNYYKVIVRQFFISKIRLNLINLINQYSYKSFIKSNVGHIQNSLTGEIWRVSIAYITYVGCVHHFVLGIVYMSFAFLVDWRFAFLVSIGGFISSIVYKKFYVKTKDESKLLTENTNDLNGLIIQFIGNFKYLKATGLTLKYSEKIKENILNLEENNRKLGKLESIINATREPILILVICGVIILQVVVLKGAMSLVLISLLFFYRALTAFLSVQSNYNSFLGLSGSLNSVADFEKQLISGSEKNGDIVVTSFKSKIEVENVSFNYDDEVNILENVNFNISKNETIAFVGESGSGKTTIVNLILGLIKPSEGKIKIDELDLKEIDLIKYQNKIGYISQDPVIFSDSIYNNVTFWAEFNDSNKKRFVEVLKQASIFDFIEQLPEKENTILGNNGINLSGGQKQRLAIARELFKDVELLILDEATSALDSENEKLIQDNINALKGNVTLLIIAHRLSTIVNADKIIILEKGKVIEQGSFQELLKTSSKFEKMVRMQQVSNF